MIESTLGQGGMGVVYAARDTRLGGRPCAVKVLAHHAMTPTARARFDREVRLTSSLASNHIVRIDNSGHLADGRPYLVMERLDGQSLADEISVHGPMDPRRAVGLIDGVLMGLAVAHAAGIVHRDVKPANVFLVDEGRDRHRAVLLDFGVARPYASPDVALTGHQTLIGTPAYMAPEQIEHGSIDGRSDLYAVGLMLRLMLHGHYPFDVDALGSRVMGLSRRVRYLWCHLNGTVAPLPSHVSPALGAVLERLRARDPDARYASAVDVMLALRETPEGRDRPSLDPTRLEALAPRTVAVDVASLDFGDVVDTIAAPSPIVLGSSAADVPARRGISDAVLGTSIAGGVMLIGGLVYWMTR